MKKPHFVIIEEMNGIPVKGGCSSCKDVTFNIGSDVAFAREFKQNLGDQFRLHFRNVHEREYASPVAARIVKEATEEK